MILYFHKNEKSRDMHLLGVTWELTSFTLSRLIMIIIIYEELLI